ncbi:hypothetical protein H0266_11405 [Halobacillus locisalis]|uniref:Uncharacterized protein n=1 Tax=Halobacillus locisalis TaxID=220753 RepID=A0A838CU45_9BACI|nr:hypothetical protein [Halobacillus locisalis]MBA2175500.1 hypothetical protein [Halobacillus locisalis]
MAQLSKLFLDQQELSLLGRYSVRIDRTIVVEPFKPLTEDTCQRILNSQMLINRIGIQGAESMDSVEYEGPYSCKRVFGVLVFSRVS